MQKDLVLAVSPMPKSSENNGENEYFLSVFGNLKDIEALYGGLDTKDISLQEKYYAIDPVIYVLRTILSKGNIQNIHIDKNNALANIFFMLGGDNRFNSTGIAFNVVKSNLKQTGLENEGLIFTRIGSDQEITGLLSFVLGEIKKTRKYKEKNVAGQLQLFFSMGE